MLKAHCRRAYLSEATPGCLEAPHLQSLLEEVKGICDYFADHSSTTTTHKARQVSFKGKQKQPLKAGAKNVTDGTMSF